MPPAAEAAILRAGPGAGPARTGPGGPGAEERRRRARWFPSCETRASRPWWGYDGRAPAIAAVDTVYRIRLNVVGLTPTFLPRTP